MEKNGKMKAFGAGLLSSFGELEYCLTDKPEKADFDPAITGVTDYPITEYQPKYYVTKSFEDAQRKMRYQFYDTLKIENNSLQGWLFKEVSIIA